MNGKSAVFMDNNGKDTKHIRNIFIIMYFVRNGEDLNIHKTLWCQGGFQLADMGNNNFRGGVLNPILRYAMVKLEN